MLHYLSTWTPVQKVGVFRLTRIWNSANCLISNLFTSSQTFSLDEKQLFAVIVTSQIFVCIGRRKLWSSALTVASAWCCKSKGPGFSHSTRMTDGPSVACGVRQKSYIFHRHSIPSHIPIRWGPTLKHTHLKSSLPWPLLSVQGSIKSSKHVCLLVLKVSSKRYEVTF